MATAEAMLVTFLSSLLVNRFVVFQQSDDFGNFPFSGYFAFGNGYSLVRNWIHFGLLFFSVIGDSPIDDGF